MANLTGRWEEVILPANEFDVLLSADELTTLQNLLDNLQKGDEYAFRRAFVPYKSADHDEAIDQFDEQQLFQYLRQHGSLETQQTIDELGVLAKLRNTGYQDKGYDGGSPTNK